MDLSSILSKAKTVLATVAPLLGTALGGPLGTAAGALVASALGTKPGDVAAANAALLTATPDQLIKLKEGNEAFKLQMAQLGVTEDQLQFADVQSARTMEISTKSLTPTILSYGILGASVCAFLGIIFGLVHIPADIATAGIFGSALTYLTMESKAILGYWFGTTQDSGKKSDALAQIAKGD